MMTELKSSKLFAIDVETTGLGGSSEIVSAAISWESADGTISSRTFLLDRLRSGFDQGDKDFQAALLSSLFNAKHPGVVLFHNAPFDLKLILLRYGFLIDEKFRGQTFALKASQLCSVMDTLAISRLLKNNKYISHADPDQLKCHSLKFLAKEFFPSEYADDDPSKIRPTTFEDATDGGNIRRAKVDRLLKYNREDTELTIRVFRELKKRSSAEEWQYFEKHEKEHILNVLHLSWCGITFDKKKAFQLIEEVTENIERVEREIFKAVGKEVNLTSTQQLGSALFNNPRVEIKNGRDGTMERLSPLYKTTTGQAMVDLDTFDILRKRIRAADPNSSVPSLISNMMKHIEWTKTLSKIETIERFAFRKGPSYFIYPNISASAKSGRVVVSRPNVLGLPKKVLKKEYSDYDVHDGINPIGDGNETLIDAIKSVRELIAAPPGFKILSIDVSGLDPIVIAQRAKRFYKGPDEFYWLKILRRQGIKRDKIPDFYFSILQKLNLRIDIDNKRQNIFDSKFASLSKYLKSPLEEYWVLKPGKIKDLEGVEFVHRVTGISEFIPFPNDNGECRKDLEMLREFSKKLFLATCYLIGAPGLAVDLSNITNRIIFTQQAQEVLDRIYQEWPEVREFQDEIGNLVYAQGFSSSIFGRRFYAETYDDLNESKRLRPNDDEYEFILRCRSKYWYVRASEWFKEDLPVIQGLKVSGLCRGLRFRKISVMQELSEDIFREKSKQIKKSKFNRKSEDNMDEELEFELSRIAITNEVDREVKCGTTLTREAEDLLGSFLDEGDLVIPEQMIILYRVMRTQNPASRFFKKYTKLIRVVKTFFPMYCQGVANSIATICLTHVRKRLEAELPEARILFFIHDEIVLMVPKEESQLKLAENILKDAIENEEIKRPFDLPFTGKFKNLGDCFKG